MRNQKAVTWFAVPINRWQDPRVLKFGRSLGEPLPEAWLERIEGWAKQYSPEDGQIAAHVADIAFAIRWPFPTDLAEALRGAQLLDADGCLIGWAALNGWLVQKLVADRERKAIARRPRTVRGLSKDRPRTVRHTVPDRTVPDRTGPDRTVPNQSSKKTKARAHSDTRVTRKQREP